RRAGRRALCPLPRRGQHQALGIRHDQFRRRRGRHRRHHHPRRSLALRPLVAGVGYDPLAKALHWITALLVLGLIGLGLWMVDLPISLTKLLAYGWHKWIGLVVLVLTIVRLLWRWRAPPLPLPDTVAAWHRRLAPW